MPDAYDNLETYARQMSFAPQQLQESSYPVLQAQMLDQFFTYSFDHRMMSTAGSYSPSSMESPLDNLDGLDLMDENQMMQMIGGTENEVVEKPSIEILVQPVDKFRFRYKSEMMGTHGSLSGEREDSVNKKDVPTAKLINCKHLKNAVIRCTLATADEERRYPHPHHLVRKNGNEDQDDPHDIEVSDENEYTAMFTNMGIIHTAKKHIRDEILRKRKIEILEDKKANRVRNPRLSVPEEVQMNSEAEKAQKWMNLNVVALCFQGFSYGDNNILYPITDKVYSRPINNLKSALTGELKITRIDKLSSPVEGNEEVWILVEKVGKKNIKIKLFELDDKENIIWEGDGKFSELDVHHQYAIVFKTPPYKDLNITKPVQVYIRLERPSDNEISNSMEFAYKPSDKVMNRKRARIEVSSGSSEFSQPAIPQSATLGNIFLAETLMNFGSTLPELSNVSGELNNLLDEEPNKSPEIQNFVNNESEIGKYFSTFASAEPISFDSDLVADGPSGPDPQKSKTDFVENVLKRVMEIFKETEAKKGSKLASISKIQNLLLETTNFGDTPLHYSIRQERYEITKSILLLLSTDPSYKVVVNAVNSTKKTPLHLAVAHNQAPLVCALLKLGADPNLSDDDDATPLHYAVMANAIECIKELIQSKTKLNLEAHNEAGWSALHLAVKLGSLSLVMELIKAGADVNVTDMSYGRTVLHIAVDSNHKQIIQYLLTKTKIDVNKKNFGGNTALHNAVVKGGKAAEELVSILKAHGADPAIRNHNITRDDEEEEDGSSMSYTGGAIDPGTTPTIKSESSDSEDNLLENGGESSFDLARDDPKLYELLRDSQSINAQGELELKEESEDEMMLQDRVKARVEAQVRKAIFAQQSQISASGQISAEFRPRLQIPKGAGDEKLTDEHVNRIVPILNKTGKWVKLAEHTQHGSLVRLYKKTSSPSAALFIKIKLQNPDITVRQVKKYLIDIQAYEAATALEGNND
ncbi:hypothetical protein QAD02_009221 [Eretmocerus hayati]|uniref:Uncharacterized protein n=1 Tax=Eretmocerus hayati TaxID=131215 RepID=A0ACC2N9E6_9HYME|nr:hypothetical protein QAD02_009221 [Eretmocerus hayati]